MTGTSAPIRRRPPLGAMLFCAALMIVGVAYVVIAVARFVQPDDGPNPPRDIASEARALIRQSKPTPLSEPLADILKKAEDEHFDSYKHPLVGKPAPEFTRPDVDGRVWSLKGACERGPVVVVFYLGYYCNHCVSQLFDANEDLKYFKEMGAELVALSPDSVETTKEKYKEYGPFGFPVLSDHGNRIAEAYGVFTPRQGEKPENLDHGTFIIDRQGIVRWAAFGPTPFGHNPTLLHELAKLREQR